MSHATPKHMRPQQSPLEIENDGDDNDSDGCGEGTRAEGEDDDVLDSGSEDERDNVRGGGDRRHRTPSGSTSASWLWLVRRLWRGSAPSYSPLPQQQGRRGKGRRRGAGGGWSERYPILGVASGLGLCLIAIALLKLTGILSRGRAAQDGPQNSSMLKCHSGGSNSTVTKGTVEAFLSWVESLPQDERCVARQKVQGCSCQGSSPGGAMPNEPSWNASWQVAHARNRQLAQAAAQQHGELDVLLLGDSITESWLGTSLAQPAPKFDENHHVYSDLFDGDDAPAKGLALGIAGDRCAQLLYRLENGEVAPLTSTQKHPKVAWVLIGTNDFLWSSCREEEIVAGNVRVAQTLLRIFPRCTVVLQSLLPVSRSIGGDDLPAKQSREAYRTINRRLDCYAQSTPRVQFANVTGLFLTSRGEINRTMLPDGIHPGGVAAQEWGAAIVEHVQRIVTHIGNQ